MNKSSKEINSGKLDNFYQAQKVPMSVHAIRFYFSKIGWMFPKKSAQLFWNLFTRPKARTLRDWHQEFYASANERKSMFVENREYVLYRWGNGPKNIVLLHGWEGMAADFKGIIEELAKNKEYSIIAFDFPAHGNAAGKHSNLALFIKGMQALLPTLGEIHAVIGHSLGASAAFFSLVDLKDKVKAEHLVLMGSYPIPYHFFKTFRAFMHIPKPLFDKCVDYVEDLIGVQIRRFNMYEMRHDVPVKSVLLIHDIHDEVAHIDKAFALAGDWSNAKFFKGDHGGHFKHFRHPAVIQKISQELNSLVLEEA